MQIIYDGRKVQIWEFVSQGLNFRKWSTGKHCDGVAVVKKRENHYVSRRWHPSFNIEGHFLRFALVCSGASRAPSKPVILHPWRSSYERRNIIHHPVLEEKHFRLDSSGLSLSKEHPLRPWQPSSNKTMSSQNYIDQFSLQNKKHQSSSGGCFSAILIKPWFCHLPLTTVKLAGYVKDQTWME